MQIGCNSQEVDFYSGPADLSKNISPFMVDTGVIKAADRLSIKKKSEIRNGRNGQTCEKSTLGDCWECFSESRA